MNKRLLVFSDGTWNSWRGGSGTNVVRLYQTFQEIDGEQLLTYDAGVGTDFFRFTGGAFGFGISRNIKELYRFIVDNYEPGDLVYLFGFSRGAFSVRSLGGLLERCGILKRDRVDLVDRAFEFYKAGPSREADHFRRAYAHEDFEIRVIGVWDTVGALGVPFSLVNRFNPFAHQFHDTRLGRHVRFAFHAVSIDENRRTFRPTLWSESEPETPLPPPLFDQRIRQAWFAGHHGDVGGTYAERGLSDAALAWMIAELRENCPELAFKLEEYWPFVVGPDPVAPLHDERKHIYRLWPHHYRTIKRDALIDPSVHRRVEALQGGYRPVNLP